LEAWKPIATQHVEVRVFERGEPGDVLVHHVVFALVGGQRPQLLDGGVQLTRSPQHGGIEDQTERERR
jgi:hypothetical protein